MLYERMDKKKSMVNMTREQFFEIIKKKRDVSISQCCYSTKRYLKWYDKHFYKRFFVSWNWSAFVFSSLWVFYRNILWFSLPVLFFTLLNAIFCMHTIFMHFLFITISFAFGLFGNALYFYTIKKVYGCDAKLQGPRKRLALLGIFFFLLSIHLVMII